MAIARGLWGLESSEHRAARNGHIMSRRIIIMNAHSKIIDAIHKKGRREGEKERSRRRWRDISTCGGGFPTSFKLFAIFSIAPLQIVVSTRSELAEEEERVEKKREEKKRERN